LFYLGGDTVIRVYGFSREVAPLAGKYLQIRLSGIVFTLFFYTGLGFYRGLQNAVIPMYASIATNAINLILDILLIYGYKDIIPEMGIAGAAWATVTAQIAGAMILVYFGIKKKYISKYRLFHAGWKRSHFVQLFRLSIHLFLRTLFLLTGFLVGGSVAARMGTIVQAADEIAMKLWLLGSFTMDAFAVAGQALIGKYRGETNGAEYLTLLKKRLLIWGLGIGLVFMVFYFFNRHFIISIFTADRDVIDTIITVFPLMVLFQPVNSITFVTDGILIGQERTRYMMRMTFFAAMIYSAGSYFSLQMDWGITGLWLSLSGMMLWRFGSNLAGIRK
jgi:putative MATE family efflux protein